MDELQPMLRRRRGSHPGPSDTGQCVYFQGQLTTIRTTYGRKIKNMFCIIGLHTLAEEDFPCRVWRVLVNSGHRIRHFNHPQVGKMWQM